MTPEWFLVLPAVIGVIGSVDCTRDAYRFKRKWGCLPDVGMLTLLYLVTTVAVAIAVLAIRGGVK